MHVIFVPYGKIEYVDMLLRDMRACKHRWRIYNKETGEEKYYWLEGSLRVLPFGIYEYVFPKEDLDQVLNTLLPISNDPYNVNKYYLGILRKILKAKPIPEFKKEGKFVWTREHVSIIPIGIREDGELTEVDGPLKGWSHEAV